MAAFLAPALARLRAEVNNLWPDRDRTSDGWIGDLAHLTAVSDHNPDWASGGIVRAIDIDEDFVAGLTHAGEAIDLVEQIITDDRVSYLIYEGQIWQNPVVFECGGWLPYTGVNAHRHHVHISVRRGSAWDRDTAAWGLTRTIVGSLPATGGATMGNKLPVLARGSVNLHVGLWQALLGVVRDNAFGPGTQAATKSWQDMRDLTPDGSVGPATWESALLSTTKGYLSRGDFAPQVAIWQTILGVVADESFGPVAEAGTKAFQVHYGLEPDGRVGPATAGMWRTQLGVI